MATCSRHRGTCGSQASGALHRPSLAPTSSPTSSSASLSSDTLVAPQSSRSSVSIATDQTTFARSLARPLKRRPSRWSLIRLFVFDCWLRRRRLRWRRWREQNTECQLATQCARSAAPDKKVRAPTDRPGPREEAPLVKRPTRLARSSSMSRSCPGSRLAARPGRQWRASGTQLKRSSHRVLTAPTREPGQFLRRARGPSWPAAEFGRLEVAAAAGAEPTQFGRPIAQLACIAHCVRASALPFAFCLHFVLDGRRPPLTLAPARLGLARCRFRLYWPSLARLGASARRLAWLRRRASGRRFALFRRRRGGGGASVKSRSGPHARWQTNERLTRQTICMGALGTQAGLLKPAGRIK